MLKKIELAPWVSNLVFRGGGVWGLYIRGGNCDFK